MTNVDERSLPKEFIRIITTKTDTGYLKWKRIEVDTRVFDPSEKKEGTKIVKEYAKNKLQFCLKDVMKTKFPYKDKTYINLYLVFLKLEKGNRIDILYYNKKKHYMMSLVSLSEYSSPEYKLIEDLYDKVKDKKYRKNIMMKNIIDFLTDDKMENVNI